MEICCQKFKRLRRCVEYSKWSELPICLLSEILKKLNYIDDYVRFGAVCVSWRIAALADEEDKKNKPDSTPIFLLVPSPQKDDEESEKKVEEKTNNKKRKLNKAEVEEKIKTILAGRIRSLYSFSSKRICNFQVNLPFNKYCRGSNFGWLITMQREERHGYNHFVFHIQLHNPLVSYKHNLNVVNLPSLNKIVKLDGDKSDRPFLYLRKAILSSDPLYAPKKFVVMSIISSFCRLAFYRSGDKDWTPIEWENENYKYFDDVIYFKKTQLFYAVHHRTGAVFTVDLKRRGRILAGNASKLTQIAPLPPIRIDSSFRKRYLVETSSGGLLQVIKEMFDFKGKADRFMKVKFEVLELDTVGGDWILRNNIGDDILFLGDNCSIARSASHCPGCKPNSVYYMYDSTLEQKTGRTYGTQDSGIYNLEDGTIQPHYPLESKVIFPQPIWFEPTLGRCN